MKLVSTQGLYKKMVAATYPLSTADFEFIVIDSIPSPVRAHKALLSISSGYMNDKFESGDWQNALSVEIRDTTYEQFSMLIQYFYTSEVILTDSSVTGFWRLVRKYAVDALEEKCIVFMCTSVNIYNCITFLEFALEVGCNSIVDSCSFCISHSAAQFLALDATRLCSPEAYAVIMAALPKDMHSTGPVFTHALEWAYQNMLEKKHQAEHELLHMDAPNRGLDSELDEDPPLDDSLASLFDDDRYEWDEGKEMRKSLQPILKYFKFKSMTAATFMNGCKRFNGDIFTKFEYFWLSMNLIEQSVVPCKVSSYCNSYLD